MTELETELDVTFAALAHATRRSMLARLTAHDLSVGELAAPLPVSLAAASKHVHVLERAGLVERTVIGRRHEFRLRTAPLAAATQWLDGAGPGGPDAAGPRSSGEQPKNKQTKTKRKPPKTKKAKADAKAHAKDRAKSVKNGAAGSKAGKARGKRARKSKRA